jgi:hypothetical protein
MNSNRNSKTSSIRRALHTRLQQVGLSAALALAALLPAAGCENGRPGPTETGEVMLSVAAIPENVSCIRVTITGEFRDVVSDFQVAQGDTLVQSFSGLPVGPVVFSANAYAQACTSVTKSTVPMWLSEDKTVNVAQGKSSSVTLTLYKNGRAKVTVEFADQEDGGTDAGIDGGASAGG